ncbi:protein phosphatase inhibitor 2 [Cyclospora cayetanensis]|uniref:Protein phosphatase inhibitor 2 n=1 Tax=Cyclospora cayetanensis TaxID=88456 RepID=A0A6P6RZ18_9EIME|nr:protein phosphatase inhibitor 2 [Cyclospora cayetanensis]
MHTSVLHFCCIWPCCYRRRFCFSPLGIRWDEEMIAEHDLLRGTRIPITEPKTPYNRERVDDEEPEEQPQAVDPSELAARLVQLEDSNTEQQKQVHQEKDFRERRKQHYNEFHQSKLMLQSLKDEDEDEE